ncbi:Nucleoside 2-deoxyribosyltransferase [Sinosporangium album]|uniref:Nucleoside 2-deoxyribosyltransferase n=1 Tax=Sinosporangium album TaxID=504805 RepID=A0A1G8GTF2_9ACTN|nr:nucleoside 2-deoxyribosyltransferase [Sinosporangium album]SDH97698.1 Nucleoside 2-deoxyribosyltransferase [Sinosporangium album]
MALYYVAHRLFAAHDRSLGAYVAHHLARRFGQDAVFLPFCDTDEENLDDPRKGQRLFDLDRERLTRIDAMVAILHGPSLDDGVCMEIGYAASRGVPVVVITTDFQVYGPTADAALHLPFPDPLLHHVASQIIAVPQLGPPTSIGDRFERFLGQNLHAITQAATEAADALSRRPTPGPALQPANIHGQRRAYLEPSPYGGDGWTARVSDALHARGFTTHRAGRLATATDPTRAALTDWTALGQANLAVVDLRGPETPPGAALIVGACAATGRPVYAPEPGCWWTFAHGREPNYRNLMIQYGLTATFSDLVELAKHLEG